MRLGRYPSHTPCLIHDWADEDSAIGTSLAIDECCTIQQNPQKQSGGQRSVLLLYNTDTRSVQIQDVTYSSIGALLRAGSL